MAAPPKRSQEGVRDFDEGERWLVDAKRPKGGRAAPVAGNFGTVRSAQEDNVMPAEILLPSAA
jgi:hypothetical protein